MAEPDAHQSRKREEILQLANELKKVRASQSRDRSPYKKEADLEKLNCPDFINAEWSVKLLRDLHGMAVTGTKRDTENKEGGGEEGWTGGVFRGELGVTEPSKVNIGDTPKEKVKDAVSTMVKWLTLCEEQCKLKKMETPVFAATAFLRYVILHAHPDANGRTAQLLTSVILRRQGLSFFLFKEEMRETISAKLKLAKDNEQQFIDYLAELIKKAVISG